MSPSSTRPGRSSSRDKLLDAAAELVTQHGVQNLTIEAVAAAANVTKGGLIYHFKTREDLLAALVERMVAEYEELAVGLETLRAQGGSLREPMVRYIDEALDMPENQRRLLTGLLTAVVAHPELIGPVRSLYARSYEGLAGIGTQAGPALMVSAALDGISLMEMLGLHRLTPQQQQTLRKTLKNVAKSMP